MTTAKARKKIAIITGASAGLGAEFALQMERRFFLDEIWLVARRLEPMQELAEKFMKSRGRLLSLDLTRPKDLASLRERLEEEQPAIQFLVNNAGYGKIGPFAELGVEEQMRMVELNVNALTFLSRVAIPFMPPGSAMIQVASSIGFTPAPNFAVYAATKAYVVSLSEALSQELKKQGIQVLTVCPGPVSTEFFSVAQKSEYMRDKVGAAEPANAFFSAHPQDVVAKALSDLNRGRRRSVYGLFIKAFVLLIPFVPRFFSLRILARRHNH